MSADPDGHEDLRLDGSVTVVGIVGLLGLVGSRIAQLVVVRGQGRMWRRLGEDEETVRLEAGVSIAIPVGAHFQFRNDGDGPLDCVGVTMPPWPGMDEAYEVEGAW